MAPSVAHKEPSPTLWYNISLVYNERDNGGVRIGSYHHGFRLYVFLYGNLTHVMLVLNKAYLTDERKLKVESQFYNLEHQFTTCFHF